jgi:hypothetical protein
MSPASLLTVTSGCKLTRKPCSDDLTLTDLRSKHPWSTYAVQLTTFSPPAIIGDALLWLFLLWGVADWPAEHRQVAIWVLLAWMIFSKFIKLITHFVRYPVDFFMWPLSILFGYLHGAIKMYALATLSEVSLTGSVELDNADLVSQTTWGSRAGADADDKDRMIRQKKPRDYFDVNEKYDEKMPLHDAMNNHRTHDLKRSQALPA